MDRRVEPDRPGDDGGEASLRPEAGELDHLGPLLKFRGDELLEFLR
jgi:hypothetical protein